MLAQAVLDGFLLGAVVAPGAIGASFTLAILRFANLSQGDLMAIGAYAALCVMPFLDDPSAASGASVAVLPRGWMLPAGLALGAGLLVALSLALERWMYLPLRRRGADSLALVFASFGLALIIRNVLMLIGGPDARYLTLEIQLAFRGPGGLLVLPNQLIAAGVTAALLGVSWLLLRWSRAGVAMRAMAENPRLAEASGVNLAATVRLTWVASGVLVAFAGVCYGMTVQIRPEMGGALLLPLLTAAILGGVGNFGGAVLGAVIIGLAESLAALVMPPVYKPLVSTALLLAVLNFRPNGLLRGSGAMHRA